MVLLLMFSRGMRRNGYHAAAIVSSYPLTQRFGFGQGFRTFDEEFPASSASIPFPRWEGEALGEPYDRRADETTRRAIRWLDQVESMANPFFLWVHYFDPNPTDHSSGPRDRTQRRWRL